MNRPSAPVLPAILWALSAWALCGCQKPMPSGDFMEAYRKENGSVTVSGDYRITVLPLTDEYLAARMTVLDSAAREPSPVSGKPGQGLRVSVQIELRDPTGSPEDQKKDLLYGTMRESAEAFRKRLHFLENKVSAFAYLECGDAKFQPVTYRFNRGIGFPAIHSFLFLFQPAREDGKAPESPCSFGMKDFGLGLGTLKATLRAPSSHTLKRREEA